MHQVTFPDRHPPVYGLIGDPAGGVWVQRTPSMSGAVWTYVDERGSRITLRFPEGRSLLAISPTRWPQRPVTKWTLSCWKSTDGHRPDRRGRINDGRVPQCVPARGPRLHASICSLKPHHELRHSVSTRFRLASPGDPGDVGLGAVQVGGQDIQRGLRKVVSSPHPALEDLLGFTHPSGHLGGSQPQQPGVLLRRSAKRAPYP